MIDVDVKITGLDNLKRNLERAPVFTVDEVSRAIQKSLHTIRTVSLREAPVNKTSGGGNLRQKISTPIMTTKLSGKIVSQAPYSVYVHQGTRPHVIKPKRIGYKGHPGGLANKRTGWGVYNKVNHPGTAPNPFFKRAVEKSKSSIERFFREAINNITKTITR
ncbi:MAG: hypothetical protein GX660_26200 [Clostridiaceae bacterium]|nr:hypothetical protein [Clostridiaceae bacterium]